MRRLILLGAVLLACSNPLKPVDSWIDVEVVEWSQDQYSNGRWASVDIYYNVTNTSDHDLRFEVYFDVTTDSLIHHYMTYDYYSVIRAGKIRTYKTAVETNWQKANKVELIDWQVTEIEGDDQ